MAKVAKVAKLEQKMKSLKVNGSKVTKEKRWKKGHSCASNPESTKFRTAAKSRFFVTNTGWHNIIIIYLLTFIFHTGAFCFFLFLFAGFNGQKRKLSVYVM